MRSALSADRERLVTLTGRGGSGKTTLALTAATQLLDEFAGGVWLVRLANVAATDLANAIASAVGATVETEGSATSAIVARLRQRGRTLLVLDNLEHLLATSQAPLRLGEELIVPLDALADEDALALIVRVGRRRSPAISDRRIDRAIELAQAAVDTAAAVVRQGAVSRAGG